MIAEKYIQRLQKIIRKYLPVSENRVVLFGSALTDCHFQDIDVGILGEKTPQKLRELKYELEASTFPFIVDIVDLEEVDNTFLDSVLHHQKIQWI